MEFVILLSWIQSLQIPRVDWKGQLDPWSSSVYDKKSLSLELGCPDFAANRWYDCLSACLNPYVYQVMEERNDLENTLESEGSGLYPASIHYLVLQPWSNYLYFIHFSVPIYKMGMITPQVSVWCPAWKSVYKALIYSVPWVILPGVANTRPGRMLFNWRCVTRKSWTRDLCKISVTHEQGSILKLPGRPLILI